MEIIENNGFIRLYLIFIMAWCALNYRSFDVRRECLYREYFYLLPAEVIGIKDGYSPEEMQEHLSEFNSILKGFEVCA
jgi:tRNA U38,U39,U40 pseudouridine synthase TruA